ncbi:hypothetical protein N9K75_00970 [bacterium]|nr:hypothetical protein [bacterium]
MSDTSDTSTIDDKRTPTSTSEYMTNVGNFLGLVVVLFVVVLLYFSSSGLLLYACKAAQSNMLPNELNCSPYTKNEPKISSIPTNIFKTETPDGKKSSVKLTFPHNHYNFSHVLLDPITNYKKKSDSYLANYFISIIESVLVFNYMSIDKALNMLNGLNEGLIVSIGPIISVILFWTLVVSDFFYFIFLWFYQMSWFFKTKNSSDSQKWETVGLTSPMGYIGALILVFIFFILFFCVLIPMGLGSWALMVGCMLTCITYSSSLNDKPTTSLTIIKYAFFHFKPLIMKVFMVLVILATFSKIGNGPGMISLILALLLLFGIIKSDLFLSGVFEKMTPFVSDKQAPKECPTTQKKDK